MDMMAQHQLCSVRSELKLLPCIAVLFCRISAVLQRRKHIDFACTGSFSCSSSSALKNGIGTIPQTSCADITHADSIYRVCSRFAPWSQEFKVAKVTLATGN